MGLMVGSGMVESACDSLVAARFKEGLRGLARATYSLHRAH